MMYKRVLLQIPEGLTLDSLSDEQRMAVQSVFGQFVMPMPGTVPHDGFVVCDAVTTSNFDQTLMGQYQFNWTILGVWDESGSELVEFKSEQFLNHLPEPETGVKVLYEPHRWAGWPVCFG